MPLIDHSLGFSPFCHENQSENIHFFSLHRSLQLYFIRKTSFHARQRKQVNYCMLNSLGYWPLPIYNNNINDEKKSDQCIHQYFIVMMVVEGKCYSKPKNICYGNKENYRKLNESGHTIDIPQTLFSISFNSQLFILLSSRDQIY